MPYRKKEKQKECMMRFRKDHPDKVKEYSKKWYLKNLDAIRAKHRERNRKFRKEHPDVAKSYQKKGYIKLMKEHPELKREYARKYWHANPHKVRMYKIKQKYKLSEKEYVTLLGEQNNKCAICEIGFIESGKTPCVDHCHITGKVRGLLCSRCNRAIGQFKDSVEMLQKSIDYLLNN